MWPLLAEKMHPFEVFINQGKLRNSPYDHNNVGETPLKLKNPNRTYEQRITD